jgi:predicted SprT family Zn-dependent metalloprotease
MHFMSVTTSEYRSFQKAYDFFNGELFDTGLPQVLITLQRQANTKGYFSPKRFGGRLKETFVDELAMNPDTFKERTDREILSTLVHEMVHVWQDRFGKASRGRYHNREWANKMKMLGLQPSHTGRPGGREVGQRMSHYILEGDPFSVSYDKLERSGFKLSWNSRRPPTKRRESKVKYTCQTCGQNAWAKPDALLLCGHCQQPMLSVTDIALAVA